MERTEANSQHGLRYEQAAQDTAPGRTTCQEQAGRTSFVIFEGERDRDRIAILTRTALAVAVRE